MMFRVSRRVTTIVITVVIFLAVSACSPSPTGPTPQPSPSSAATSVPAAQTDAATEIADVPTVDVFPTPQTCDASIIEQAFEHGRMFWVGTTSEERCLAQHTFALGSGEIWVAIFDADGEGGEWLTFPDSWVEGSEAELDPALTPPADKLQPIRGFGKVWRDMLTDEQWSAIGWALGQELAHVTQYRYDAGGIVNDGGTYIPRPGSHTLISLGGETFVFDEETASFSYEPGE